MTEEKRFALTKEQILMTGGTLLASGVLDVATHFDGLALFAGAAGVFLAYRHGNDVLDHFIPGRHNMQAVEATAHFVDAVASQSGEYPDQSIPAKLKRLVGMKLSQKADAQSQQEQENVIQEYDEMEELQPLLKRSAGMFTFSQVLRGFQPSLAQIYLATLEDGSTAYSPAKGLCHVALAGSTGNGKSSIIRLLMAQLCKAGACVVLLNPHYTRYDLDAQEDWTPYEPYLEYSPMECRKYEVIESILERAATVILPKRLDAYAESRPIGKPYFLVLDELPAIMAHIKDAPEYLAAILREGRKVGIFVICASQDFLVKTLKLDGGAMRDCYRTAFYVGGDSTTARVLLDLTGAIDESELGQGVVKLRCKQTKQAVTARVPYVDNNSLYRLLGPSTYKASTRYTDREESLLEPITDALEEIPETPRYHARTSAYDAHKQRIATRKPAAYATTREPAKVQVVEKTELDLALEAWDAGNTTVDALANAIPGKTQWTVRPLYAQVKKLRGK